MEGNVLYQAESGKTLTLSREDLIKIINSAVDDAFQKYKHECRFNISQEDAEQIENYFNAVKEVGDGELAKGLKIIAHNHEWLIDTREKSNKIINSFVLTVTGAVALALVYTIWEGIKHKLGVGK